MLNNLRMPGPRGRFNGEVFGAVSVPEAGDCGDCRVGTADFTGVLSVFVPALDALEGGGCDASGARLLGSFDCVGVRGGDGAGMLVPSVRE